ncbi:DsrE/DsrF-like family protein [mine drainage metagenome]|uniref:DsrE/DsrF-like family protein n=1 Tax=mine drainage metagenome TaxID=410659 RepID=A0A1J5NZL5_9ZZZZ
MADHHYLDNEEKSVIIVMTSGPSTPHRCATPFYIGAILASMEADVSIFFTMEAVKLTQKGVAENLAAMDGGKSIIEFIRDAKAAGVKLYLCKPAMPGYQLSESDIIDEIDEIANASKMADLILACDKSMFF